MDLRNEILGILETAREKIVGNIEGQNIKASGRTQNALKVEDRGSKLVLLDDGGGAPFETLQYGREPGKVPAGFRNILKEWLVVKNIAVEPIPYKTAKGGKYTPQERGLMKAAGAIAHKIATKGTDRYSQPNENVYSEAINEAIDKIEKIITTKVISEIRR